MEREARVKPWLTVREIGILERLRDGKYPKEIASEMGIKYNTLKFYLLVVRAKFGVETSNQAVIVAIRRRLISLYEE